jgi:hypothetical protein
MPSYVKCQGEGIVKELHKRFLSRILSLGAVSFAAGLSAAAWAKIPVATQGDEADNQPRLVAKKLADLRQAGAEILGAGGGSHGVDADETHANSNANEASPKIKIMLSQNWSSWNSK